MRHVVRGGLFNFREDPFWFNPLVLRRTFMAYKLAVRFLTLVTFAAAIVPTSAAPAPQQEFIVEPPPLDRPLIFDSSTRASNGNKIPGPKFRVVPMGGLSHPYALVFLPNGNML